MEKIMIISYSLTAIDSEPEIVVATTGVTINLTCNASGSPHLQYTWFIPSQQEHVNGSTLTIFNVGQDNEMDYICTVSLNGIELG